MWLKVKKPCVVGLTVGYLSSSAVFLTTTVASHLLPTTRLNSVTTAMILMALVVF